MSQAPPFDPDSLEAISKVLADTHFGISGAQIERFLKEMNIEDVFPSTTKYQRLYEALINHQNKTKSGGEVLLFIERVMSPVRWIKKGNDFEATRRALNEKLAFSGLEVNEKGKIIQSIKAETITEVEARLNRLIYELKRRSAHEEVFKYCTIELMDKNYFHAVFEAIKGVAERIRLLAGLKGDGAKLIDAAFSGKDPVLKINKFLDESDKSQQNGFSIILKGLFGFVRNPSAHTPKIYNNITEKDFLDILTFLSVIHRMLDKVSKS